MIDGLRQQVATHETELASACAETSTAKQTAESCQSELKALRRDCTTHKADIAKASHEAATAEQTIMALHEECAKHEVKASSEAATARQTSATMMQEPKDAKKQLADGKSELAASTQSIEKLQAESEKARSTPTETALLDNTAALKPLPFPTYVGSRYPDGTPVKGDWRKKSKATIRRWERESLSQMGLMPAKGVYELEAWELQGLTQVMRRLHSPGMWWEEAENDGCKYDSCPPPRNSEWWWPDGKRPGAVISLEEAREKGKRDFGGRERRVVLGSGMEWGMGRVRGEEAVGREMSPVHEGDLARVRQSIDSL